MGNEGVVFLDVGKVNELLRTVQANAQSTLVQAPRMTLFNGQRAYVLVSETQAYTARYAAVTEPGGGIRYDPVIATAEPGVILDVQATVSADRNYVTQTLHPRLSALLGFVERPWPGRPAGSNLVVQEPQLKVSQLRTICLSYDGWVRPGCHSSAGQNREESGVSTSSASTISPPPRLPNSSLVSARMMPRSRAICSARP